MKNIYPLKTSFVREIFDEDSFYRISKQNWLDLLLQTYKVFVLSRSQNPDYLKKRLTHCSKTLVVTLSKILSPLESQYTNNIYHPVEHGLLFWLEHHFNNYKHLLWEEKPPSDRLLKFFDVDLCDGLVFAVVTIAHCPYLKKEFVNFYALPDEYDQAMYNAAKLLMVWKSINITFEISAQQIVNPNSLQMLLLCCYLYDFLPNMTPTETMVIQCPLSGTSKKTLSITNENNFTIRFTVIFFKNEHECFSTNVSNIAILPKKHREIEILYHAKFMQEVEAVLVLSGESMGYHYAKSKVYDLKGIPNILDGYQLCQLEVTQYGLSKLDFQIKSPFALATWYKLYYSTEKLDKLDYEKVVSYEHNIQIIAARLLFNNQSLFTTDENGTSLFNYYFV